VFECCIQHPDHLALSVLNGHNAMVAGSYKHAIGKSDPTALQQISFSEHSVQH